MGRGVCCPITPSTQRHLAGTTPPFMLKKGLRRQGCRVVQYHVHGLTPPSSSWGGEGRGGGHMDTHETRRLSVPLYVVCRVPCVRSVETN